jgi:hypothetical protein
MTLTELTLTQFAVRMNGFTASSGDRLRYFTDRELDALWTENEQHPANRRQSIIVRVFEAQHRAEVQ